MPHISATAAETPAKPALILAPSGEVVDYGDLDRRSNQIAQLLRTAGVHTGDHIALLMGNRRELIEIACAAERAGVIFSPIPTHLGEEDIRHILENSGATLFFAALEWVDIAQAAAAGLTGLTQRYLMDGVVDGWDSFEEVIDQMPECAIDDQALGAPLIYTAGTTGRPKAVLPPRVSKDYDAPHPLEVSVGSAFGFGAETTYLSTAPLYQAAPIHYNLLVLATGGTSVVMERFDAEAALALIETHRVTHSQWVPMMFMQMLKLPAEVSGQFDLGSMQVAIHAGAPCPIAVKEAMIAWWGPIIYEYYSASEGAGFSVIDSEEWMAHKGSVGKPLFGEPKIVSIDGRELPPGQIGKVFFADPQHPFDYHGDREKSLAATNEHGWVTVGDVGYLDEEGFLYLTDRAEFTVTSGGVDVFPAEIENVLITHDKVADVAVFGVPSDEHGESVRVVVEPENWADATDETAFELLEWLRERLSHIQVPSSLVFHDRLPRQEDGKLHKRSMMEAARKDSD
ncbi:long-chain-fatty-acid--CoA ligase [Luminiphilus syltensis NOR5-1B]|uniref:Long-chain-fatty-acid--CoA ligase n=1 Tax=Luminiphilus syltensis NOR5-1B TaxID=565045 RepID=B8KSD2_9GAMM|nr:AMP-binding protein [Luminiphilus syltensis]EED34878.1 long-chain-fatty-acid--CoA ligase [Luminiphilus syltensis NOR5-1B]